MPFKCDNNIKLAKGQKEVLDHVLSGKNTFFTGCAGTGKTVLLREISKALKRKVRDVGITASTGLAAYNLGGCTLHSWAGIGLGNGSAHFLTEKIKKSRINFRRWNSVKALIIDEISMISGELFEKLEKIARNVRKKGKDLPFGGIQLVLCGDFLQLPPVKALKMAFETTAWTSCIPDESMFALSEIFRQKDREFIEMLSQLRRGTVTLQLNSALEKSKNSKPDKDCVIIYSHRATVSKRNTSMLANLKTSGMEYVAFDDSPSGLDFLTVEKYLKNCPIPKKLRIKVGAPVILLKNITSVLVNGSRGIVKDFYQEDKNSEWCPVVYFKSCDKEMVIERTVWEIERPDGSVLASRNQIPLALCWALTIHKCQGLTLESATMDLSKVWEPGQFYVAVSRLTSLEGLKIIGDFKNGFISADDEVINWMEQKKLLPECRPCDFVPAPLPDNVPHLNRGRIQNGIKEKENHKESRFNGGSEKAKKLSEKENNSPVDGKGTVKKRERKRKKDAENDGDWKPLEPPEKVKKMAVESDGSDTDFEFR